MNYCLRRNNTPERRLPTYTGNRNDIARSVVRGGVIVKADVSAHPTFNKYIIYVIKRDGSKSVFSNTEE